jgi:GcrA cell cycle regulator
MSDFWHDEERVARLRKLWAEGLTGSKIGLLLGTSRCAVIAKAHRIGLPARGGSNPTKPNKYMSPSARIEHRSKPSARSAPKPMTPLRALLRDAQASGAPMSDSADDLSIPADRRKKLVDLEAGECRWPIGDPQHADFGFCAQPQLSGTPYCTHHARRAYEPSRVAVPRVQQEAHQSTPERVRETVDA